MLAARIIKFRDRLGGFYDASQLRDVYGLNDTLFQIVLPQVQIRLKDIRFINLSADSVAVMSAHPYIGRKLAWMIFNYRNQHSGFHDIEEMKNLPLVTDEIFRKLAPYLKPG